LVRGADVLLDVNGRLLGFQKKLRAPPMRNNNPVLCRAAHPDGIFMNNVLVGFRIASLYPYPAKHFEKRIKKFARNWVSLYWPDL